MATELVVVHAQREPPAWWDASVFLAGPTPRDPSVASWRPAALDLISRLWTGGRLVVFVPESPDGGFDGTWTAQVEWEDTALWRSDAIVFWIPRDKATLPGLTTNVEWGRYENSGRVVLGTPPTAPSVKYLRHHAALHGVPVRDNLTATVETALATVGPGARRQDGERDVPLSIWDTPSFQRWYAKLRQDGNELRSARPVWTVPGFAWALRVAVRVAAEDRVKTDEIVVARPDSVAVVLYGRSTSWDRTPVVLVREFRGPGGHVLELPGGSGPGSPLDQAVQEVCEETGLVLEPARLRSHGVRPVNATFSTQMVEVFSAELSEAELASVASAGALGRAGDGEVTHPEVRTLGEIRSGPDVDWATLGLLSQVLGDGAG